LTRVDVSIAVVPVGSSLRASAAAAAVTAAATAAAAAAAATAAASRRTTGNARTYARGVAIIRRVYAVSVYAEVCAVTQIKLFF